MLYPVIWMVVLVAAARGPRFSATSGSFQRTGRSRTTSQAGTFSAARPSAISSSIRFVHLRAGHVGNLISCSLAAYAFARLKFRLKWFWFALMLGTIMLPIHAQLIPQYIFFLNIGWVNTIPAPGRAEVPGD